jgi:hypothetical protein
MLIKINKLNTNIILVCLILFELTNISCNSDKKRKKYKPSASKSTCDAKFVNPHEQERTFMATKQVSVDLPVYNTIASVKSVESVIDNFNKKCSKERMFQEFQKQTFNFTWRYEFFESPHCIRIELDLGNITRFKSMFNLNYYTFSYRELSRPNIHLKRNPINESINSLVIHRVHIRPYIVCVSFYKNHLGFFPIHNNINNNSTEYDRDQFISDMNCSNYNEMLMDDERVHDVDLCVDIDTNDHFLSLDFDAPHENHEISGELIMVLFIMCLLVVILSVITFANYLIEKPKKRQMLKALRDYLQKKTHSNDNHNQLNINSVVCSQNSLNAKNDKRKDSNPAIVVTDFSNRPVHENGESDPLLGPSGSSSKFEVIPLNTLNSGFTPITANTIDQTGQIHKVTFNIGETIYEESPSASEIGLSGKKEEENQIDESVKTISHLLDDKPWLSSTPSQGNFYASLNTNSSASNMNTNATKSHSRSNSLITASTVNNNNNTE